MLNQITMIIHNMLCIIKNSDIKADYLLHLMIYTENCRILCIQSVEKIKLSIFS